MKKINISYFFSGYIIIEAPTEYVTTAANIMFINNITFKTVLAECDKTQFLVRYKYKKALKELFVEYPEIKYSYGGLAYIFTKYKTRMGIPAGILLGLLLLILSEQIIWDIEVSGNTSLSDNYIAEILTDYGVKEGVLINEVKLDELHNEILIEHGNIGWLRVNFRGTTAFVEVIEYTPPKIYVNSTESTNIVASRDARIISADVRSGQLCTEIGATVKAGDLLISGIIDSSASGYSLKNADGIVIGEVVDTFEIEIPYKYVQKEYTGNSYSKKSLLFWGNEIKLYKNSGNNAPNYDIIKRKNRLELFDAVKLPFFISETVYNEYVENEHILSVDEAIKIADSKLKHYLSELSDSGDILSKKVTLSKSENFLTLEAIIYHTVDIAKEQPISISEQNINTNN